MQSERFSRQTNYAEFGTESQKRLTSSSATIIGVGALGSVVSTLLVRAGIGSLHIIDKDKVCKTNLHRQILYSEQDIGRYKSHCAKQKLSEIDSEVDIYAHQQEFDENADGLLKGDLVIDCSDNMDTRLLLNRLCKDKAMSLLHLAAIQEIGTVIFFKNASKSEPCLRCIYDENTPSKKCSELGVMNTITTLISSLAVSEAMKFLVGRKSESKMLRFDLRNNTFDKVDIKQNPDCPVCFPKSCEQDESKEASDRCMEIKGKPIEFALLKEKLKKNHDIIENSNSIKVDEVTFFPDGLVRVYTDSENKARKRYNEILKELD